MAYIFEACLVFSWIVYFFETYLDFRQHNKLKEPRPKELESIVTEEKFNKSQIYGLDKSNFGFIQGAFSQVEGTLILVYGFLPYMWDYSEHIAAKLGFGPEYEIIVSIIFLFSVSMYQMILGLPFSLYSTFVIEERHGFNKQTLSLFFVDKLKGLLLGIALGVPVISALLFIIKWGGPQFYIYAWGFLFVFSMIMMTIFPTLIAPLFNKYEPLEDGELKKAIEALAMRVKFPLTKLYKVDGSKRSSHSNAYLYGFFSNKRIVIYDTLIDQTDQEEIVSILGHEIGHWSMNHVVKGLVISQVHLFISLFLFGQMMYWDEMYTSFGFTKKPLIIGLFIFFQFIMSPVEHVIGFAMNALTRKFEFEADAYSKHLGMGKELKSGLIKIFKENSGNMNPDTWYSTYHHSHPPLLERLRAIGGDKSD